jgi:hypothetical protein
LREVIYGQENSLRDRHNRVLCRSLRWKDTNFQELCRMMALADIEKSKEM